LTETATARCEATTRTGDGCKNPPMTGSPWCHGHDPGCVREREVIASAGGRAQARDRSRPATDNSWSDIGEAEQAARNAAVARENICSASLATLIDTRARQVRDEPPIPDRLVARDALRSAETRSAWAEWHREQAGRHRATLDDLIAHHERAADRLEGGGGGS
jgi:hypothetical protein